MPIALALALSASAVPIEGGGSSAFVPAVTSGLIAMYDPEQGYTGGGTATWENTSPTQPITGLDTTSTTPPTNAADAGYSDRNTVQWDGADTEFIVGGAPGGTKTCTGLTVFAIGEPGTGAAYRYIWSADEGGAEVSVYVTPTGEAAIYNGTEVATVATWTGKQAFAAVFNGASSRAYLSKKSSPDTGTATAPASIADNGWAVASYYVGSSAPWKGTGGTGKLALVLVYNRNLSEAEVGQLMDQASTRWGVTVTP